MRRQVYYKDFEESVICPLEPDAAKFTRLSNEVRAPESNRSELVVGPDLTARALSQRRLSLLGVAVSNSRRRKAHGMT